MSPSRTYLKRPAAPPQSVCALPHDLWRRQSVITEVLNQKRWDDTQREAIHTYTNDITEQTDDVEAGNHFSLAFRHNIVAARSRALTPNPGHGLCGCCQRS